MRKALGSICSVTFRICSSNLKETLFTELITGKTETIFITLLLCYKYRTGCLKNETVTTGQTVHLSTTHGWEPGDRGYTINNSYCMTSQLDFFIFKNIYQIIKAGYLWALGLQVTFIFYPVLISSF